MSTQGARCVPVLHFTEMANQQKWAGNHTIEVNVFDGKGSLQESLNQLKTVIDQGYRFIAQGNGSKRSVPQFAAMQRKKSSIP